jgi:RecA-family ATPase
LGRLSKPGYTQEPSFIVSKLFKTKSINFISGPKGNGKTEYTLGLSDIISKGGKFLNYEVEEPYPVIYIDGEMDEYDLIERRIPYTQHTAPINIILILFIMHNK